MGVLAKLKIARAEAIMQCSYRRSIGAVRDGGEHNGAQIVKWSTMGLKIARIGDGGGGGRTGDAEHGERLPFVPHVGRPSIAGRGVADVAGRKTEIVGMPYLEMANP